MTTDPFSAGEKPRSFLAGLLRPRMIVWSIVGFLAVSLVVLLWAPELLLNHWLSNLKVDSATVRLAVGNAAQVVLFSLGGIIALVGVGLSLSRHGLELDNSQADRTKEQRRVAELAEQRGIDTERDLRSRFAQVVTLLSDPDKPTTRQAGVYALGALADDWTNHGRLDERQVCVDVLCGYLRSYWDPEDERSDGERRIRVAAFDVIAAHLRPNTYHPSWDGATFNLAGALIDFDVDFSSITANASDVNFYGAKFSGGHISISRATFSGGHINFSAATFSGGNVYFNKATFSGGNVYFRAATFSGGNVNFDLAKFSGGKITFEDALFSGGTIRLGGQDFKDHPVLVPWDEAEGTVLSSKSAQ
jgi:Pentapeptide repeats (9 copies)